MAQSLSLTVNNLKIRFVGMSGCQIYESEIAMRPTGL